MKSEKIYLVTRALYFRLLWYETKMYQKGSVFAGNVIDTSENIFTPVYVTEVTVMTNDENTG